MSDQPTPAPAASPAQLPTSPAQLPTSPAQPDRPAQPRGQMLPGVAMIVMFLLLVTLLNVFAVFRGVYGVGATKYGALGLCSILLLGIVGLLRMRRWGHAIVMAGCLLLSSVYFFMFTRTHVPYLLVQGFFALVFFLYLVRPEVRDRML